MTTLTHGLDHLGSSEQARHVQASKLALPPARQKQRRKTRLSPDYLFVLAVCFTAFFVVLILERLLPPSWRSMTAQFGTFSLLADAKAAAHRCAGIAFQG
jgi:hypothetical protein